MRVNRYGNAVFALRPFISLNPGHCPAAPQASRRARKRHRLSTLPRDDNIGHAVVVLPLSRAQPPGSVSSSSWARSKVTAFHITNWPAATNSLSNVTPHYDDLSQASVLLGQPVLALT